MRYLIYISLLIVGLIAINELSWIGKTDLAMVVIGIALSVFLQGLYLIQLGRKG